MAPPLVLYLHVPKTAGTTLTELISGVYKRPGVTGERVHKGVYYFPAGFELEEWDEPEPSHAVRDTLRRQDITAVVGHFHFGLHDYTDRTCRYVTMLRHPVDRMLSLHRHMQRHYELTMGLEEFLLRPPLREADNGQTRRLAGILAPVGECSETMLRTALANLERIDVVGTTSQFDESLLLMSRVLGWQGVPAVYYPRNVERQRRHVRDLPAAVRDLILERSKYDVALYDAARRRLQDELRAEDAGFWRGLERYQHDKEAFFGGLDEKDKGFVMTVRDRFGGETG